MGMMTAAGDAPGMGKDPLKVTVRVKRVPPTLWCVWQNV